MKTKAEILAALLAAGVQGVDETMTVEKLKSVAAEMGVSLEKPRQAKAKGTAPGDDYYDGMRQAKVAAGLSLTDAIEVTARQRKEDEASGFTLETTTEELPEG